MHDQILFQLILECTDIIIYLVLSYISDSFWVFDISLFHYSPFCINSPASTSPVLWLQVWVTTQHYNINWEIQDCWDGPGVNLVTLPPSVTIWAWLLVPIWYKGRNYLMTSIGKWRHKCKHVYTQINNMKLKLKNLKNFS